MVFVLVKKFWDTHMGGLLPRLLFLGIKNTPLSLGFMKKGALKQGGLSHLF